MSNKVLDYAEQIALPSIFNLITLSAFGVNNQQEACAWALDPTNNQLWHVFNKF